MKPERSANWYQGTCGEVQTLWDGKTEAGYETPPTNYSVSWYKACPVYVSSWHTTSALHSSVAGVSSDQLGESHDLSRARISRSSSDISTENLPRPRPGSRPCPGKQPRYMSNLLSIYSCPAPRSGQRIRCLGPGVAEPIRPSTVETPTTVD